MRGGEEGLRIQVNLGGIGWFQTAMIVQFFCSASVRASLRTAQLARFRLQVSRRDPPEIVQRDLQHSLR